MDTEVHKEKAAQRKVVVENLTKVIDCHSMDLSTQSSTVLSICDDLADFSTFSPLLVVGNSRVFHAIEPHEVEHLHGKFLHLIDLLDAGVELILLRRWMDLDVKEE